MNKWIFAVILMVCASSLTAAAEELQAPAGAQTSASLKNWGAVLGFSPLMSSQMSDELNSDFNSTFDVGVSFKMFQAGYRRGTGAVPSFQAPPKGLDQSNMVYSTLSGGKQTFQEIYMSGAYPLLAQVGNMPDLKLSAPLFVGIYSQTIEAAGRTFGNMAYDLAAGLELKWFSKNDFTLSFSTLYHAAIPFWGVRESAGSKPIKNDGGTDIQGRHNGLEARMAVGFLFWE